MALADRTRRLADQNIRRVNSQLTLLKIIAMKFLQVLFFIIICGYQANAQTVNWKKLDQLDLIKYSSIAPIPTRHSCWGSFHFGYPNLDGHKTDSSKMLDVAFLRTSRKRFRQLVDVLASFKPTRIYVESR